MYVIKTEEMKVPLKVFSTENSIEEQCIEQMKTVSSLPFLYHHVALMPDGHLGIGASIGSVVATNNVVIPSLVGVDIGCGMCFSDTYIAAETVSEEQLKRIMELVRERVPVGFNHHKVAQGEDYMPKLEMGKIVESEYKNALGQVGTLGGGNHFIEFQKDENGSLGVMIHSGSRNLGKQVADYYNRVAEDMRAKYFSVIPKEWGLAFFPIDEASNYLKEMRYCVDFAFRNRKFMMDRILEAVAEVLNPSVDFAEMINIAHNYTRLEHHFGRDVWVHRKGATSAKAGEIGIIPGSMGTSSYIVNGLGNIHSFQSCSHGAGRRMGRKEAQRTLSLAEEQKKMEGVLGAPRSQGELEEAPGAYKAIDTVMSNQSDLVKILVKLKPMAVIKG